jgi:hypothetical protein
LQTPEAEEMKKCEQVQRQNLLTGGLKTGWRIVSVQNRCTTAKSSKTTVAIAHYPVEIDTL